MKIVFIDHFGCFAAVVKAAHYLNLLSAQATLGEILNLPYFADENNCEPGKLYYLGKDCTGTEVYTLGVGPYGRLIKTVVWPNIQEISDLKENIVLADVSNFNPLFLIIIEVITKGKVRRLTKYLWAYWFQKLKGIKQLVDEKT